MNKNINKVSVCITISNEKKKTVDELVNALNNQTLKFDEIIIIDSKKYHNCSRAEGRNIAIKKASNNIIAITDAGCIPHNDWLEKITKPLLDKNIDVVAGGYKMIASNSFQKACAVFLGLDAEKINKDFIPSARSMAFTKSIWKKVGGFPEVMNDTAEDTLFNTNLITSEAKYAIAKNAVVGWEMPDNLFDFALKIRKYAAGDIKSGIWWHPVKKFKTHNIKVLTIFVRYLLFLLALLLGLKYFLLFFCIYLIYAYLKSNLWGVVLQIVSDFAAIIGFSHGILQTSFQRS